MSEPTLVNLGTQKDRAEIADFMRESADRVERGEVSVAVITIEPLPDSWRHKAEVFIQKGHEASAMHMALQYRTMRLFNFIFGIKQPEGEDD